METTTGLEYYLIGCGLGFLFGIYATIIWLAYKKTE
jgi:hypothetical protein